MKLEQFREIADENLKDLNVDERMVFKIRQKMCAVQVEKKPRIPRAAYALAAACVAVMAISGGVLLATGSALDGLRHPMQDVPMQISFAQPENSASTLSSQLATSQFIDGSTLSYGIKQIGEYSEGFAPAQATNGLYGYINEEGFWVVRALYDEVQPVQDGKAVVVMQGVEQIVEIP